MKKWILAALLLCCQPATALDQAQLAAFLELARVEMEMPGLRAAVRLPDGAIIRAAVGLADRENDVPLDDTVGMPGGSTGKTFVAALTMLLVEDGLLSLDDPVSRWLGGSGWYEELPNAAGHARGTPALPLLGHGRLSRHHALHHAFDLARDTPRGNPL